MGLVSALFVDKNSIDIRWTDGLDLSGMEMAVQLDQDAEIINQILLMNQASFRTLNASSFGNLFIVIDLRPIGGLNDVFNTRAFSRLRQAWLPGLAGQKVDAIWWCLRVVIDMNNRLFMMLFMMMSVPMLLLRLLGLFVLFAFPLGVVQGLILA